MLTLWGPRGSDQYCDGRSRRSFLQLGGLAMGGLSLPALLQAEALARGDSSTGAPGTGAAHKSVIMIYLAGGPAHQDTFDLGAAPPAASAASTSLSPPGFPEFRSASICLGSLGSWTRSP